MCHLRPSSPGYDTMSACVFKFKYIISGGNRGVDNEVGVVATFPARLRILRIFCGLCVLLFTFMQQLFYVPHVKVQLWSFSRRLE